MRCDVVLVAREAGPFQTGTVAGVHERRDEADADTGGHRSHGVLVEHGERRVRTNIGNAAARDDDFVLPEHAAAALPGALVGALRE